LSVAVGAPLAGAEPLLAAAEVQRPPTALHRPLISWCGTWSSTIYNGTDPIQPAPGGSLYQPSRGHHDRSCREWRRSRRGVPCPDQSSPEGQRAIHPRCTPV